jgi:hypothetical protein
MNKTCSTCKYWNKFNSDPEGECRRNAPNARVEQRDSKYRSINWPITIETDWCGDHTSVPAKKEGK